MKTRFIIDVATGVITRSVEGVTVPEAQVGVFYARDWMDCEVQYVTGSTTVTSDVLSGSRKTVLGLRQYPSYGALLAQSSAFAYTPSADFATCSFDLNTSEVVTLIDTLPTQARSTKVYFEVQTTNADGTKPLTMAQQLVALYCEVNQEGDEPPATAATSAANASASATAAASSASAAATSATSAAASAAAAASTAIGTVRTDLNNFANSRAPLPGLVFNGTGNAYVGFTHAAGSISRTFSRVIRCPSAAPSAAYGIFCLSGGTSAGNEAGSSLRLEIASDGSLFLQLNNSDNTGYRRISRAGFVTAYAGKFVDLCVVIDVTVPSAVLYENGQLATTTESTGGAGAPTWATAPNTAYLLDGGGYVTGARFSGYMGPLWPFNRALSAAEVTALYESGTPSAADYCNAGVAVQLAGGFWSSDGVATLSNNSDTTVTWSDTNGGYVYSTASNSRSLKVGTKATASITVANITGTVTAKLRALGSGGSDSDSVTLTNGVIKLPQAVAGTGGLYIALDWIAASSGDITASSYTPLGLVGAWDFTHLTPSSTSAPAMPNVGCGPLTWTTGVAPSVPKSGIIAVVPRTVATLPAASTCQGSTQYVTDANATTRMATVAGGGSNKVVVFSDGANWLIL